MNPIVKDGLKIVWKVENVDSLDANGKYSPELVTDNFKWKLAVQTKEINKIKYLALYFYSGNEKSSWLAEVNRVFKVFDKNGKVLKQMNGTLICYTKESHAWGWDQFLKWSDLPTSYNSKIEFITVECQFSFKYYDFSKNPAIFSDASFKGGTDEYHISKGYFCTYSKFFNEKFVKNNETTITIDDVKSEEFLMLLAALLPDPTTITSRNYDILQNLTEKFEICSLAKRCDDYFKKNQCSEIIEKIKKAEQKNDTKSIPTILSTVNRGRELKILWQDEYYEHFEDITKLACADVAFKFL